VLVDLHRHSVVSDGHPASRRRRTPITRTMPLRALAADLGVSVAGASDDHGELTGRRRGSETTSPEAYAALRSAAATVRR
jgi:hypothetical protein